MTSIVDFRNTDISPFCLTHENDKEHPVSTDYFDLAGPDKVWFGVPQINDSGLYNIYGSQDTVGEANKLPQFKKYSFGVALPIAGVDKTIVNFKLSGSVIADNSNVFITCHAGLLDTAGKEAQRYFSFGELESHHVSYSDRVMMRLNSEPTRENVGIWFTLENRASSAQAFIFSYSVTAWNSHNNVPTIHDVTAR